MTYSKDTTVGDVTTYEVYEGTPQEIIDLMNRMPQDLKDGEWLQGIDLPSDCHVHINQAVEVVDIAEALTKHTSKIIERIGMIR